MNKEEYYKNELEKYNNEQLEALSVASEILSDLMGKAMFLNYEIYTMNREYLIYTRKHFKGSRAIVLYIDDLLSRLDLNCDAYVDNLKKMYPECIKITDFNPEGAFYIECAEAEYLRSLQ